MNILNQCQFCGHDLKKITEEGEILHMDCKVCGKYKIPLQDHESLRKHWNHEDKRYIISAILRNASESGNVIEINRDNVEDLISTASLPDGPLEIIERILVYVSGSRPSNSFVKINWEDDYSLFYAQDREELSHLLLALQNMNYIEKKPSGRGSYRLTIPKGWERVDELRRKKIDSRQAFVAMWFNDALKSAYNDGFKPALEDAGYKPIRIDLFQHNRKIDDMIIAEIRKSGLLVADFTGDRSGVYFEAGFAMGLGIPVIWTCRKDFINKLHFDTRQYNHIIWERPEDLREQLIYRINATVPIKF